MPAISNSLKLYMGYDRQAGLAKGAVLIFADNGINARHLARPVLEGWFDQVRWIDVTAKRLRDHEYLRELAKSSGPHAIESPPVCPTCETWGGGLPDAEGRCYHCEAQG